MLDQLVKNMLSQAVHLSKLLNLIVKAEKRKQDENILSGQRNTHSVKGQEKILGSKERRKIKLGRKFRKARTILTLSAVFYG